MGLTQALEYLQLSFSKERIQQQGAMIDGYGISTKLVAGAPVCK